MDRSNVIQLIATTPEQDAYGVWRQTEKSRTVMCNVESVTRAEFFEAGRNGLNPEYVFTLFFGDYCGERVVVFNGNRYSVYRVYQAKNDIVELYVQREGGTNV